MRRAQDRLSYQPFYADNRDIAERLLIKARSKNWKDQKVQILVPTDNKDALELVSKYFKIDEDASSGNTWLGNQEPYEIDVQKIFSILSYNTSIC